MRKIKSILVEFGFRFKKDEYEVIEKRIQGKENMSRTLSIDKSKPVIRWAIRWVENEPLTLIEVEDIMRCIEKEGDCGWVTPVGKDDTHRWIADFWSIFETCEQAKQGCIELFERKVKAAEALLEQAKQL